MGRAKAIGVKTKAISLRKFAKGKHNQVDDTPYGGGAGMVMMAEPFYKAVKKLLPFFKKKKAKTRVIMTAAYGKQFTQADAKRLATDYEHLIFLCGRYEGIDARIEENIVDEIFSVGPYVLTGGELPALTMTDAIIRLIPGVISEASLEEESHTTEGVLEYPQYTKPAEFNDWKVPEVLLSGDHAKIGRWREENRYKKL